MDRVQVPIIVIHSFILPLMSMCCHFPWTGALMGSQVLFAHAILISFLFVDKNSLLLLWIAHEYGSDTDKCNSLCNLAPYVHVLPIFWVPLWGHSFYFPSVMFITFFFLFYFSPSPRLHFDHILLVLNYTCGPSVW
jgi:hypothetical protein